MVALKRKRETLGFEGIDWNLKEETEYGNKRFPPWASEISADMVKLVQKKWKKYSL